MKENAPFLEGVNNLAEEIESGVCCEDVWDIFGNKVEEIIRTGLSLFIGIPLAIALELIRAH